MVSRRQRRVGLTLQLVAGLLLLGSAGLVAASNGRDASRSQPAAVAESPTQFGASDDGGGDHASSPYRLKIPKLAVDSPIVAVDIEDGGVLGVPTDPGAIGWWAGGPIPGSPLGTSILAGHVNTADRGPGALLELDTLQPGDQLSVEGWSTPVAFTVEQIVRYPRTEVPPSVFDQRSAGRLAIVSCDNLDKRSGTYRDNIIVYARRTDIAGPPAPITLDTPRTDTGT